MRRYRSLHSRLHWRLHIDPLTPPTTPPSTCATERSAQNASATSSLRTPSRCSTRRPPAACATSTGSPTAASARRRAGPPGGHRSRGARARPVIRVHQAAARPARTPPLDISQLVRDSISHLARPHLPRLPVAQLPPLHRRCFRPRRRLLGRPTLGTEAWSGDRLTKACVVSRSYLLRVRCTLSASPRPHGPAAASRSYPKPSGIH